MVSPPAPGAVKSTVVAPVSPPAGAVAPAPALKAIVVVAGLESGLAEAGGMTANDLTPEIGIVVVATAGCAGVAPALADVAGL